MDHTTAQDFYPAGVFANRTSGAMTDLAIDVHFRARFGEWEITWPEADAYILAIHFLHEIV
jgi:hypothetical protein